MTKPVFATTDTASRIVTGLEEIGRQLNELLKIQAMEHGLSPLQVRILIFIHFYRQETTLVTLAAAFNLSKATLSVALRSMLQKKLISRTTAPGDQRSALISLTEWGRRIAHVSGFYPEPLKKIIAPMAPGEQQHLLGIIDGILHKLNNGQD